MKKLITATLIAFAACGAFAEIENGELRMENAATLNSQLSTLNFEECRAKNPATCPTHGTPAEAATIEALKKRTPEQHTENGKAAIRQMIADHADVKDVMYRKSTGAIDFIWGKEGTASQEYEDGRGIAHINKKHNATMYKLPGVIAHGAVYKHPDNDNRVGIIKGKMLVVLEKQGAGSYMITGFKPDNPAKYLARFLSQEQLEGEL